MIGLLTQLVPKTAGTERVPTSIARSSSNPPSFEPLLEGWYSIILRTHHDDRERENVAREVQSSNHTQRRTEQIDAFGSQRRENKTGGKREKQRSAAVGDRESGLKTLKMCSLLINPGA